MLTYTAAELRTLAGYNRPPPRTVRKILFRFRIWRPARQRERARSRPKAPAPTVNNETSRSADLLSSTAVSIGWLNVQSLRNKVDAISVITERSVDVMALTETSGLSSLLLPAPPAVVYSVSTLC